MQPQLRSVIKGMATFVLPSLNRIELRKRRSPRATARYCYSVWLRHLVTLHDNGFDTWPETVAELGPGESLGVGICALLTGSSKYYALDLVKFTSWATCLELLPALVDLFRRRERIPDAVEFPDLQPELGSYEFPRHVLPSDRLNATLSEPRILEIENALRGGSASKGNQIEITYFAPWSDSSVVRSESVDLIFSQFVLEHVDDLPTTYHAMQCWLKSGGSMSHFIDFRSHNLTKAWNGHWTCSDTTWWLMRGKRPYMLNREPHSGHVELLHRAGFAVTCDLQSKGPGIDRALLASRFQGLSENDIVTNGALIQVRKDTTPVNPAVNIGV